MRKNKILVGIAAIVLLSSHAKAQNLNNPCTPSQRDYGDWYCSGDGDLDNPGTLNPTSKTICVGQSAGAPTLSGTTFTPGTKSRDWTDDCDDSGTDTENVNYTVSDIAWDPEIPESFPECGTFEFDAYVLGIPDFEGCDEIGEFYVGTFTVTVTNISKSKTIPFLDPLLSVYEYNNGIIRTVATVTVSITYCGGATAHLIWSDSLGLENGSADVELSGTRNVGDVGQPDASWEGLLWDPEEQQPDPVNGTAYWSGWGRWYVITWNITPGNCDPTLDVTQPRIWE